MINVANDVFNYVAKKVRAEHPGTDTLSPYARQPSSFPAVTIAQRSNRVSTRYRTTNIENAVSVMFEAQIISGKATGKEAEAWSIAATVDEAFSEIGFTRMFCEPITGANSASTFTIVGRYEAVVGPNGDNKYLIYQN